MSKKYKMLANNTCSLCGSTTVKNLSYKMCRCRSCRFLFLAQSERDIQQACFLPVSEIAVNPTSLDGLRKKYPKDKHGKRALYNQYARKVLDWYGSNVRVLDIGASGGFYLHAIEVLGVPPIQLRTLEINPTYQALTNEYFGYGGDIANIEDYKPNATYDCICMFDVLEHVNKFWVALDNMRAMLNENGRVILKLPNGRWAYLKYKMAKMLGISHKIPGYLYLEPGGHLNYWDYKSIKQLEKAGFIVESFVYVTPTKEQFGRQYGLRALGFKLNQVLGLNLFPEFIAILRKN
jgi:2-polyprenyl-3-methyl-5-hydroxy-6-metoxy-1,4-benzoquinol methylase